ncbi:hypothetical protein Gbth_005_087 [Gluconobacter thailandicus F149-1 = NBRC 100600]|nr:hypothetical protein Gbfr_021_088 [Gluconobacter frateurii M-2]GAN92086.1 hypothetical protein Gbth_005_087 [Gluconobacter thailandicus F149-1 = NBRC 100600]GBR60570.1 hypothetical protein AA100600_2106 [Gluconobacter thailandicus F149-1 = NBRC 100600]GEL86007.1 hypothetical protein GTH01_03650 [Gluconobacter thailandicus F149-1 = NBRC 100600]
MGFTPASPLFTRFTTKRDTLASFLTRRADIKKPGTGIPGRVLCFGYANEISLRLLP